MSAVYEAGEKEYITHKNVRVTKDTPDEVLFAIGLRRLETERIESSRATITGGPFYKPAEDGSANAVEYYQYLIKDLKTLRKDKAEQHHVNKAEFMQSGVTYKGHQFDLRIRNLCHISMMLSLVNNDALPEDFTWYSTEGELVPMSKEECMTFIKLVLDKVKEVELKSHKILTKMLAIDNEDELFKFNPTIGSHNDI